MNTLLNYNNKFFSVLSKLADCFFLSIIWMIFCIPVITAGASTTAVYYTVNKAIRGNRGYVLRSFIDSFKSNFKQSTVLWLICLFAGIILGLDAYITYEMLKNGETLGFSYYIFLVLILLLILWMVYLFSYVARFENTTKQTMKNCAIIAVANLPKSLLILLELAAFVVIIYMIPFLVIVAPALLCLSLNLILEKIYRKYMSPEDLQREEELEMELKR